MSGEPEHVKHPELYAHWLAESKRRDTPAARSDFRDHQARLVRSWDLARQGLSQLLSALKTDGVIGGWDS